MSIKFTKLTDFLLHLSQSYMIIGSLLAIFLTNFIEVVVPGEQIR